MKGADGRERAGDFLRRLPFRSCAAALPLVGEGGSTKRLAHAVCKLITAWCQLRVREQRKQGREISEKRGGEKRTEITR